MSPTKRGLIAPDCGGVSVLEAGGLPNGALSLDRPPFGPANSEPQIVPKWSGFELTGKLTNTEGHDDHFLNCSPV